MITVRFSSKGKTVIFGVGHDFSGVSGTSDAEGHTLSVRDVGKMLDVAMVETDHWDESEAHPDSSAVKVEREF